MTRYDLFPRWPSHIVEHYAAGVLGVGREWFDYRLKPAITIAFHILLRIGVGHVGAGLAAEMREDRLAMIVVVLIVSIQLQTVRRGAIAHQLEFDL